MQSAIGQECQSFLTVTNVLKKTVSFNEVFTFHGRYQLLMGQLEPVLIEAAALLRMAIQGR